MKITRIDAFQVSWSPNDKPAQRSAFVRIFTDDGINGIGEASPMQGGLASLGIIRHDLAPALIGKDPLDHAVLLDTLLHTNVKLGPEGALSGALAALDIAMWDIKGKLTGLPIYKLLGGAWRTALPFYASIGGNGDRSLDDVLRVVETRLQDRPAAIKIRFDNPRTELDRDIPGDIAKARAVRKLVGDGFSLAFDANNGFTTGGAIRVGRVLEELGFWWFEEPVQHYHVESDGRGRARTRHHGICRRADLHARGVGRPDRRRRAHGAARHREDGWHHRPDALCRTGACTWGGTCVASDTADDRSYGQHARCGGAVAGDQAGGMERSIDQDPRGVREPAEAGGWTVPSARWAGTWTARP